MNPSSSDPIPTPASLEKIGKLLGDVHVAMLTTVADDGSLRSRPMGGQNKDFNGQLWFFTSDDSGKVSEIYHHRDVGIVVSHPDKNIYLSCSGVASIVRDIAKAKELWNPFVKAWFPKGLEDPHLALVRVDVHAVEFWDGPSSKMVNLFRMAKAALTGTTPKVKAGEHGQVTLSR